MSQKLRLGQIKAGKVIVEEHFAGKQVHWHTAQYHKWV